MEDEVKLSCSNFPSDTTTSSLSIGLGREPKKTQIPAATPPSCLSVLSTSSTTSSTISAGFFKEPCDAHKPKREEPPNINYEVAIAKSVLKQYSTLSGDNLFDHLSDIIKRVIDERPPNVIDFFEEFSRNVREQKFHLPERFPPDAVFEESRLYRLAKKFLLSLKLPYPDDATKGYENFEEMEYEDKTIDLVDDLKIELTDYLKTFKIFNERVQQLQFYWNQCGFNIASDDIFQLACSMDRLQNHPSISQCRFWGMINGLKGSYYIVEALLTNAEHKSRIAMLEEETRQKMLFDVAQLKGERKTMYASLRGPELIPGNVGWEFWPPEELAKMKPAADPIPVIEIPEIFDVPPEPVGSGINRFSYFVVTTLSDDWMELPIVTPKQIVISRAIKKYFTGDLEADVHSYPCFPGKEKHLLRAVIARITAGTHIAPRSYYRKMTKREQRLFDGNEPDGEEEEEEEEEEEVNEGEEDEFADNDIVLLLNERYEPQPLTAMTSPISWVHVRPNILAQGRVTYFNVEKARKAREKELARLLKLQSAEEMEEEEEEEEEQEADLIAEGEEEEEIEEIDMQQIGPLILTPISEDINLEGTVPWVSRFTSNYTNKMERVLVMQSNTWPGAYAFTFEKTCESIYLGWGHKYVARNMPFVHLPRVTTEYPHTEIDFIEANDPTVAEEEEYRQYLLRKQKRLEALKKFQETGGEEVLSEMETEGTAEN